MISGDFGLPAARLAYASQSAINKRLRCRMAIDSDLSIIEPDLLDVPEAGPTAIRGSLLRTIGYVAGVLLSLVAVPLLFSHLGDRDYGRYVDVIALVTIVQGITDVGLGQIGVREFATRPPGSRERLMRNLLGVRVSLTSLGIVFAAAFALAAGYGHAAVIGTLTAGAGMVLAVAQGTFAVPLAARLQLGWVTTLDFARQVLSVAGIVLLVLVGAGLLPFLIISVPVGLVVLGGTLLLVRRTMPLLPTFDRDEWSLLIRSVLPFATAMVIGTLYLRITVVLASVLASRTQNGYYAIVFTVVSVLIAIPALTVGSTLPILARAARDDHVRLDYVLQRLVEVTLIAGVGIAVPLIAGAGFVVSVLTSGTARPAAGVLQIAAIAVVTQFVGASWQYGLLALHRYRSMLVISAAGLAVSVCLTLILVPSLQARGAAIAFVAGELAVAGFAFGALRVAQPTLKFDLRVPLCVLFAAGLALCVLLVPRLSSLPAAVIASVLYAGMLLCTRAIPRELTDALLRRRQV